MPDMPNIDVHPDLWAIVRDILQKHVPQYTVWAFGSRAKWTTKPYSDLDLAIITDKPLPLSTSAALKEDFSESALPWRVDIIDWATTSAEFRGVIEKDKVVVQIVERGHKIKFGELVNFVSKKETINNLKPDNYISTENMMPNFCGIKTASSLPKSGSVTVFKKNDTLFSNIRTYFKKVWKAKYDGYCSNDVLVFRSKDENLLLPDYLYHICRWEKFTEFSVRTAKGVKMPRGDKKSLSQFHFYLPSLKKQRSISHILDTLDKKIELNRTISQTLEALAQAIFKSWFVDFEPTKAKIAALKQGQDPLRAAMSAISGKADSELNQLPQEDFKQLAVTAALFPDAMEQSELGKIPKGWRAGTLGDVCIIHDHKRIPLSGAERAKRQGDFPYYGAASVMDSIDSYLFDGTYVLVGEDGSVQTKDGYALTQYVWGKFWVNNHAHVLEGKNGYSTEILLLALNRVKINKYITGAVQPKLSQGNMLKIPIIQPTKDVTTRFFDFIQPMFEAIKRTTEKTASLTSIRDTLLPKLLSGELQLPPMQEQVIR